MADPFTSSFGPGRGPGSQHLAHTVRRLERELDAATRELAAAERDRDDARGERDQAERARLVGEAKAHGWVACSLERRFQRDQVRVELVRAGGDDVFDEGTKAHGAWSPRRCYLAGRRSSMRVGEWLTKLGAREEECPGSSPRWSDLAKETETDFRRSLTRSPSDLMLLRKVRGGLTAPSRADGRLDHRILFQADYWWDAQRRRCSMNRLPIGRSLRAGSRNGRSSVPSETSNLRSLSTTTLRSRSAVPSTKPLPSDFHPAPGRPARATADSHDTPPTAPTTPLPTRQSARIP
jgi:hypothetical protein